MVGIHCSYDGENGLDSSGTLADISFHFLLWLISMCRSPAVTGAVVPRTSNGIGTQGRIGDHNRVLGSDLSYAYIVFSQNIPRPSKPVCTFAHPSRQTCTYSDDLHLSEQPATRWEDSE